MRSWGELRARTSRRADREERKLRDTEKEVNRQRALMPWDNLTQAQQDFWETRYAGRLLGMLDRSAKFREFGQSIRFVSGLIGATVAALGGFAGAPIRVIVAVLGVTLAAVNAAPSIFSTELRVVINRRYVRQLLTEGWTFALAVTGPDVVVSSAFASFRAAVEHVPPTMTMPTRRACTKRARADSKLQAANLTGAEVIPAHAGRGTATPARHRCCTIGPPQGSRGR